MAYPLWGVGVVVGSCALTLRPNKLLVEILEILSLVSLFVELLHKISIFYTIDVSKVFQGGTTYDRKRINIT